MVAPVVIVAIIVAILVLLALLGLTAWYNTHTQACMNNLTEILTFTKSIMDDPDRANLWCPGLEDAVAKFDNQCSDLSAPAYESYIPPCK